MGWLMGGLVRHTSATRGALADPVDRVAGEECAGARDSVVTLAMLE
jgi:hypothetical protein